MDGSEPTYGASAVVGGRLFSRREELHLSQSDVARLVRSAGLTWTQETVARVETGRREVTVGELIALGLVLGMRAGDLLSTGVRVRLGKSEEWVPGRVVQLWADGDRAPDYGYKTLVHKYRAEGIADLDTDARVAELEPKGKAQARDYWAVRRALHRWVADEAAAEREVDQRRWRGKEAQLWQARREGKLPDAGKQ